MLHNSSRLASVKVRSDYSNEEILSRFYTRQDFLPFEGDNRKLTFLLLIVPQADKLFCFTGHYTRQE